MRIVSFNVNGLRSRLHQLEAVIERHEPEVIGLQETKVEDAAFPLEAVTSLGYHVLHHGQKGHYGVALLSRSAPERPVIGLPPVTSATAGLEFGFEDEASASESLAECRLIGATLPTPLGPIHVYNGYFPQGDNAAHPRKFPNKRAFFERLRGLLAANHAPDEPLVVMGDVNVAPRDEDIGIGEENRKRWLKSGKCSFLPIEREWLGGLLRLGLVDLHAGRPDAQSAGRYSWFDYRSRGFERTPPRGLRIDLILASPPIAGRLRDTGIDYDIRGMDKPSDHCPVWAELR